MSASASASAPEWGEGREIDESRLVHILHDNIKICLNSQSETLFEDVTRSESESVLHVGYIYLLINIVTHVPEMNTD